MVHTSSSPRILLVNASANLHSSISRRLAKRFVDAWLAIYPHAHIVERDVGLNPPPAISGNWLAGVFAKNAEVKEANKDALLLSDTLIAEVEAADILVIATPMYNYGMPAALKAWFDQVIRLHKTFTFDLARGEQPIEPIWHGKTLVILSSSGEGYFAPSEANAVSNFLHPHIIRCAAYLGVEKHHIISSEFQEFKDKRHADSLNSALQEVDALVKEMNCVPC